MTSRRLLHGLSLLALAALLCTLAVACSSSGPRAAGLCEDDPARALPAAPPAVETTTLKDTTKVALGIIDKYHISPPVRLALLQGAWRGATLAATQAGFRVDDLPPQTEKALEDAIGDLSTAIEGSQAEPRVIDAALAYLANAANDGHTYYLSKSEWEAHRAGQIQGGFLTERVSDGYLVKEVVGGSRAASFLMPGDVIVSINGLPVMEALRDPAVRSKEATLRLEVSRTGSASTLTFELPPEQLPWVSSRLLDGNVGYVRIRLFVSAISCDAFKAMRKVLDDELQVLIDQGARAWVLDLRDNGGGYAPTGSYVSGTFGLFYGPWASFHDREGRTYNLPALGSSAIGDRPLAILVNERSASSSEIVAEGLQDIRQAVVFGQKTVGNVNAATSFPIRDGALFVTTATTRVGPHSKDIDGTGVIPDRKVALDLELLRREGRDSQIEAATSYLRQKLGR